MCLLHDNAFINIFVILNFTVREKMDRGESHLILQMVVFLNGDIAKKKATQWQ